MINTKEMIDNFISKNASGSFDAKNKNHMYKLGKILEQGIPQLIDNRSQDGKNFKYVTWKWYEYIGRIFDTDHWFEISYADEFRVEVKMSWMGKEYKASYGVDKISIKKSTGQPINTLSEQTINEGMRCYAKLFSRATYLFYHLWLEGSND